MDRYTRKNVEGAAASAAAVGARVGVDTQDWALRPGSQTYGRAWLLVDRSPVAGGERTIANLGQSAREAFYALAAMREAFYMVESAQ